MENIIEKLRAQQNRPSTQHSYYRTWKIFNQFIIKLERKPDNWEDRLTLFIGYLVDCNKKSSTVKSYISAIKSVLRDDGVELNVNKFLLASLTSTGKYKNDRVFTRLPIGENLLKLIVEQTRDHLLDAGQEFLACLYRTLFLTAYHGLFRVGELTSGMHPVLARDVRIADNKNKIQFMLCTLKTHWKNSKLQIVKITSWPQVVTEFKLTCP